MTRAADISFRTRKWVRPEDPNANGTLFGGSLLKWIDEEAAIYAIIQLSNGRAVTKYISEINFVSSAARGPDRNGSDCNSLRSYLLGDEGRSPKHDY
jgi:acyl-CoA hydrolase